MSRRNRKFTPASDGSSITVEPTGDDIANAGNDGNPDIGGSEAVSATVDPAAFVGDEPEHGGTDAPTGRRKRGRPPGSGGSKTKAKPIPLNVTGLEKLLVGIHGGVALLSGRMEWALDTDAKIFDGKTEAEFLATSIKDVSDHYSTGLLDQKQLDWANLIQCLAIIYGGRIFAIRSNPKPKVARQATPQENAKNFSQPATHHRTQPPVNHFDNPPSTSIEIPGIGGVDIPGHPLNFKNIN